MTFKHDVIKLNSGFYIKGDYVLILFQQLITSPKEVVFDVLVLNLNQEITEIVKYIDMNCN